MAAKLNTRVKTKIAAWGGFDLSTTGLALGVRSRDGQEAYVATKMRGAVKWHGQPAFRLEFTPQMILSLLDAIQRQGWSLNDISLSFAVRQHDMVLLDKKGNVAMPALSWQCNAATAEVQKLRDQGAEDVVGRVEERFILPKLMWVLRQVPALKRSLGQVMTTGDWIAQQLTGKARLSTSDAISNGLLVQRTKALAEPVMRKAKLNPGWFPRVLQSGCVVGRVGTKPVAGDDESWATVRQRLAGAQVVAGLGDNHATGVGCGLDEADFTTVVISAGTSGTVNRVCGPDVVLAGNAACFEYYKNRLLLMMLADCCKWYDRFVAHDLPKFATRLEDLNKQIATARLADFRRVLHRNGREIYPPGWQKLSAGEQAGSTQFSIMLELLLLTRSMLAEVQDDSTAVRNFVLTGGLSQSRFFQQVFHTGVQLLAPKAKALISARRGPLRYQTAAYGALLCALRPEDPHAAARLCPVRSAARPDGTSRAQLQYLLQAGGL